MCLNPKKMQVRVFEGNQQLDDFLIRLWLKSAEKAVKQRKKFFVALAGGNTPAEIYSKLAGASEIRFWDKTHIFLSDERFVPENCAQSNYRMIKENLLNRVAIPPGNVHAVKIKDSAEYSALEYEAEIRKAFGLNRRQFPRFDLMLLGIGEDGHIASLFPGSPALNERSRLAVGSYRKQPAKHRISLTKPVIDNARQIVFLVMGSRKAKIMRDIFVNCKTVPASLLKNGNITYCLDKEAAAGFLKEQK